MAAEVLTKSRFAELVKRDAAFVTRAIASGKLSGAALVGEGRSTRIRVDVALQQLGRQLDLSQQLAQDKPILPEALPVEALAEAEPPAEAGSRVHAMREEHLDLKNRRLLLELEKAERASRVAAGELVMAGDVSAAVDHLTKAISIDDRFRDLTGEERDFDPIRSDPRFLAATHVVV